MKDRKESPHFMLKRKLNKLALNLAQANGIYFDSDHDFSSDTIGPGKSNWNRAVISWAVLMDDNAVLKYQNK